MTQTLVSRSKFAELAGVNPSTVTRLCSTLLKTAVSGRSIDAAHPDAVAYLQNKHAPQTPAPATGIDSLYEEAVAACQTAGRCSGQFLRDEFKIGSERAKKLMNQIKASGVMIKALPPVSVPDKPTPAPLPEPKLRGLAAAKETKKREATGTVAVPDDIEVFLDWTLRELLAKFGADYKFVDWLNATQKIEMINEKRLKNATTKGLLVSRDLVQVALFDPINSAHMRLMKDGAKSIALGVVSKHAGGADIAECEAYVSDQLGSFIRPLKSKITRALKG